VDDGDVALWRRAMAITQSNSLDQTSLGVSSSAHAGSSIEADRR